MLAVHQLSKTFGITPVLHTISFTLNAGEKTALVGPNGCGKTTLLRILAGLEGADEGVVAFNPPRLRVGYLPQGFALPPEQTLEEYVDSVSGNLPILSQQLESVAENMARDPENSTLQKDYAVLLSRIEAASTNSNPDALLSTLGLGDIQPAQKLATLSGGQKTRLGLAGVLLANPECLLLDEPTNHLDFEMLEWLENWLTHAACAVLVVSHDRAFLDNVASSILELDPVTHKMRSYTGNYSAYLEQKQNEFDRQKQEYSDQQNQIRELTRAAGHMRGIATFHKGGKADSGDKFANGFFANRGLATIKRAKSIEARIEKLVNEDHIEKPRPTWQMKMNFRAAPESGRDVLILKDLAIGYGQTVILRGLNGVLRYGERAALIGPNGCGKTTLLKTAAGQLDPLEGSCRLGANVIPGYLSQEQSEFKEATHALSVFQRCASMNETDSRTFLHKYLFRGEEVFVPMEKLSYGQRARFTLACLVAKGCNFLMLDEPLNHLDLPSRAQFENALASFTGTILIVVHDRYFIQRYATCLWQIKDNALSIIA